MRGLDGVGLTAFADLAWTSDGTDAGEGAVPSIRTMLDDPGAACESHRVTSAGVPLVMRRHIDYLRVSSSLCPR